MQIPDSTPVYKKEPDKLYSQKQSFDIIDLVDIYNKIYRNKFVFAVSSIIFIFIFSGWILYKDLHPDRIFQSTAKIHSAIVNENVYFPPPGWKERIMGKYSINDIQLGPTISLSIIHSNSSIAANNMDEALRDIISDQNNWFQFEKDVFVKQIELSERINDILLEYINAIENIDDLSTMHEMNFGALFRLYSFNSQPDRLKRMLEPPFTSPASIEEDTSMVELPNQNRTNLYYLLSFIFGLIFGSLIALLAEFLSKAKNEREA